MLASLGSTRQVYVGERMSEWLLTQLTVAALSIMKSSRPLVLEPGVIFISVIRLSISLLVAGRALRWNVRIRGKGGRGGPEAGIVVGIRW